MDHTLLKQKCKEAATKAGYSLDRVPLKVFLKLIKEDLGLGQPYVAAMAGGHNRAVRGYYTLETDAVEVLPSKASPKVKVKAPTFQPVKPVAPAPVLRAVQSVSTEDIYIPRVDKTYISWGESKTLLQIVKSWMFYPTYISGMSGNGKTVMVEQACAKTKREYVRVQISPETDEDDLIGGFRLIDGETVFQKGPVIRAMERGAILLLDEVDRGTEKIMCLQGVLEGKPVLLKKTGEMIMPAPGFNVIATANTKGRGDDEGRYSAAAVIDDAMLERYTCTIEQEYPSMAVEKRILSKFAESLDIISDDVTDFIEKVTGWADVIRKTHENDGVDETISTRRLKHIISSFAIFGDRTKAITMCINRFDAETKDAFLDLYSKVDGTQSEADAPVVATEESDGTQVPF